MSGIALTALVQLLERGQALAPPPLHPRRRIRVRQARVLDRYGAPRLTRGLERDVDAGPGVAPVEASRPGFVAGAWSSGAPVHGGDPRLTLAKPRRTNLT